MSELFDKIRKQIVKALSDYQLIAAHDRVMVAVSGGKDSAILYLMLKEISSKSPYPFEVVPVILDQKQPGFAIEPFQRWIEGFGTPLTMIAEDTYSIVKEKTEVGKSYCGLCSRLRRGILYTYAKLNSMHKIALGHHRDDLNVTLLMNAFFNGSLASMPAKLLADDGCNTVIRPMVYVSEDDLTRLAKDLTIPVIPCNLCGSQDNLQRTRIKRMLHDLSETHPKIQASLIAAQSNIKEKLLLKGVGE